MKPPPRKRSRPNRTLPESHLERTGRWQRHELMKLLSGLKRLSRAGEGAGDMDYSALRTSVRTRTEAEIQKEVDALKDRVITSANFEYRRRRREDRRDKKPIQLWMHMASSVTGTLEETINTAFAQMLIVSSTEPRTLKNCDPPELHTQRPEQSRVMGRTVTPRPRSRPTPATSLGRPCSSSLLDVTPAPTALPLLQDQPSAAPPASAAPCGQGAAPAPQAPVPQGPPGSDSSAEGANTQMPSEPQTPVCTPPSSAPRAAASPPLSGPPSTCPAPLSRGSRSVLKDRPRMLGVKCVVDFEKIYRFLSVVLKPGEECHLTPMEGAILLDLMMSLQEELPKLDCSNLKKHLKQVYQGLSARSDTTAAQDLLSDLQERLRAQTESPAAPQTDQPDTQENPGAPESGGVASQPPEVDSQSSASNSTSSQAACPPLNPFMVPVKLLKCKEAQPQTG